MYGTVAKFKAKKGALEALKQMEERTPSGFVRSIVYRLDKDPNEFILVVIFKDKESYFANAESPQQHEEYMRFRAQLKADPEWNDGEIVFDTDGL
jgi:quinol monooxygenase YgiN